MVVDVSSTAEWRRVTSSSTIVVTDFYADWCGPCKQIAPTFEALSTKFSKPNRITFAKVNVDNQKEIAQMYSVRAMPTFKILRNGSVIETIQGANPPALTAAVEKAVKLAGPGGGNSWGAGGRTLGGSSSGGSRPQAFNRPVWDLNTFINAAITFFGLYFSSLFSLDPYMAAQNCKYNIANPPPAAARPAGASGAQRPGAPTSSVRTLADLGDE